MELMKELSLTPGVSGSEEKIANIIKRELKDIKQCWHGCAGVAFLRCG